MGRALASGAAAMGNHGVGEYVSWPGVATLAVSSLFFWLSNRSGRQAKELESVPRLQTLGEIGALLRASKKTTEACMASLTGRVCSDDPLKCENVPDLGVIHRSITREVFMKKNDRGEWKRDNSTLTDFTRETRWHVEDGASKVRVHVNDGKSATGLQLKAVFVGFEADGAGGFQGGSDLNAAANLLKVGADLWQGVKKIGTEKTEGILPLGTTVTCVGEVSKLATNADSSSSSTARAAEYVLRKPMQGPFYITTQTMPELVQGLSRSSRRWLLLGIGVTCLGSYLIARKLYKRVLADVRARRFREEIRRRREGGGVEGEGDDEEETSAEKTCVICMHKKYDTVFTK